MRAKGKILLAIGLGSCLVMAAFGCAPQPNAGTADPEKTDEGSAIVVEWTIESDCESCHEAEVASRLDSDSVHSVHAAQGLTDCTSCHTDDDGGLTKGHKKFMDEDAEPPTELKKSKVPSESCSAAGCHVVEDLVAATVDVTVLTDKEGTVVNPHEMMIKASHQAPQSQVPVTCADCHAEHSAASTGEQAYEFCKSCHHHDVYECNTCHA